MDLTKTNNANIIYRLPNSKNAYICCGSILSKIHDYINDYETEFFVISAFNQNNNPFVFSIASKQIFEYGNHDMFHQYYSNKIYPNLNKNHYIKLITKAVHELKINNSLKKIVLSRPHIKENNNFNPILLFNQLCETFPTAFIYLVSCNDTGTWIGASPEILLTSNPNEIQTVALAGTIDNNEKSMWSSKEYEEQHLVEIYIEEILLKHARTFNKTGPEELKSGSIKLKTKTLKYLA